MAVTSLADASAPAARALGRDAARALGHVALLRVLPLAEGERIPARHGPDTIALIVAQGLLVGERATMAGPGDVIFGDDGRWTACTTAQVALIGTAFARAAQPWPGAIECVLAQARERPVELLASGTLDERLLGLLWRLAQLWAAPRDRDMVLPLALTDSGLARLTGTGADDVRAALAALERAGSAAYCEGAGWTLPGAQDPDGSPHSRTRRDALRARTARELALARQTVEAYVELSRRLDTEVSRARLRRGEDPPLRSRPGVG